MTDANILLINPIGAQGPQGPQGVPGDLSPAGMAASAAAIASATAAAASQGAAATSASNAATSASNAATSETNAANSAASAALSSAAAGTASGRLEVATFAEIATVFGYTSAGGRRQVASGDRIRVIDTGRVYLVLASTATGAFADYTGTGGIKINEVRQGAGGVFTNAAIQNPTGSSNNLLIRNPVPGATRVHIEPNGYVDSGTVTKLDFMLDPFDLDPANYRIGNMYTINGDPNGTGESGIFFFGTKNVGHHWGNWTSVHFGFTDDGPLGPMKMMMIDHSAPQYYSPHRGGWRQGEPITAGDYIQTFVGGVGRTYQAASSGTTGATVPSHTTGTVSDGGVSWTFVRQITSGSVAPVVVIGNRDAMPLLGHLDARMQIRSPVVIDTQKRLRFTNSVGVTGFEIYGSASGVEEWFYELTAGGGYTRTHMTANYRQQVGLATCAAVVTAPDGATTVDVTGVETLRFNNTSATTVTALTGGQRGQRVRLTSGNSNTTLLRSVLTSGGRIRNQKGTDITLTIDGAIDVERDGSSDFWRVVGVGY